MRCCLIQDVPMYFWTLVAFDQIVRVALLLRMAMHSALFSVDSKIGISRQNGEISATPPYNNALGFFASVFKDR